MDKNNYFMNLIKKFINLIHLQTNLLEFRQKLNSNILNFTSISLVNRTIIYLCFDFVDIS
jgi:hypothetical protein